MLLLVSKGVNNETLIKVILNFHTRHLHAVYIPVNPYSIIAIVTPLKTKNTRGIADATTPQPGGIRVT